MIGNQITVLDEKDQKLVQELVTIGFNPAQSKLMVALLHLGEASMKEITEVSGMRQSEISTGYHRLYDFGIVSAGKRQSSKGRPELVIKLAGDLPELVTRYKQQQMSMEQTRFDQEIKNCKALASGVGAIAC